MRAVCLLALSAALAGCSLVGDDDGLAFRVLASTQVNGWPTSGVARSAAEAEALADRLGLAGSLAADFDRETIVAVSTAGACPASNYALTVTGVDVDGSRATVSAHVERVGDSGFTVLVSPVAVVAVEGLGEIEGDRVDVRLSGDDADCLLE